MHQVVLGAGGIGGLLAAVLSRAGERVTLVLRPSRVADHPRTVTLRSVVFGDGAEPVEVAQAVPEGADVVWVAVKSTALTAALRLADPARVQDAAVVPLLNGVDHVAELRRRYRRVQPATIRVESHRVAPGVVDQRSPFAHIGLATGVDGGAGAAVRALEVLRRSGFATATSKDETTLLWDKLAFLAPIALATAAWNCDLGGVRDRPEFRACQLEALAAAHADGAATDLGALEALTTAAPATMRSSMQLDVDAGREPELDAVAGAVLRRCSDGAPATRTLAALVEARLRDTRSAAATD